MSQILVTGEAKIRDIQGPVVANSGVITALDGAASQYVRGDGTLADFPTSTGGGSSVSYYLNGSVNQGTFAGSTYYEMSKTPIIGAGTDFPVSTNGLVSQFITDANDPDLLEVPGGNFNVEFYFSVSNNTGNPTVYAELYKYDGTTFTLLGSSVAVPESLNQGTTIAPYYFAIPVATAALALTDRIAIRIYANVDGRTVTLHTENSHLCQVVTTFSKGMVSLNNLTDQSQFLTTGTSGTNFAIVSSGDTHTFNLPVASATNTGKLSSSDWSIFNGKVPYTGANNNLDLGVYNISAQNAYLNGVSGVNGGNLFLKHGDDFITTSDYTTVYSLGNNIGFVSNDGTYTKEAFISLSLIPNNQTRSYSFPDQSGTFALLEGSQTFSGAKTFSASVVNDDGLKIKFGSASNLTANYLTLSAYGLTSPNRTVLRLGTTATTLSELYFSQLSSYQYTFPDASGTLALTSNLSAYLPLTGGTLTGALSGTSATFSSSSANHLTLNGGTTVATRLLVARGTDDSSQNLLLGWNSITVQRTSVPLSTAQTDFSIIQQGSDGSRTPFYISSTGNVGIGTSSPSQKLEIANTSGTVYTRLTADFGSGFIGMETSDDSMRILTAQATPIQFYTDNAERMRITSGGGVKIYNGSAPTTGDGLELWYNGTNSLIGSYDRTTSTYKQLYFYGSNTIFENSGSERMRITSGGNVGIGTSSPAARLHNRGAFITEAGDQYGEFKSFVFQSVFNNPTINLLTVNATTSYAALIIKVTVYQNTVSSGLCNIHIGYANWAANPYPTIIKGIVAPTIQVSFGGGTNVGTLSWSGNTLQYTSNRMTNYDGYVVNVEWGSNTDNNVSPTYG